ncbi:hypothetical protein QJS10_CPB15g01954 [Acorus calamus]|uniref:Uncharacterized protein n=1 Tax=Acorus calamus TaxID=4465 RepID=A0AAV9D761_ACOCL|nr:hypothetical protein QJS10_CPB15g01954 [Acorus calamus]
MIRSSSLNPTTFVNSNSTTTSATQSFNPFVNCETRCEGLDLLAMAVLHVAHQTSLDGGEVKVVEEVENERTHKREEAPEAIRRQRRLMSMPSKYRDSVLQPWKPRTRRRRRRPINGSD